MMVQVSMSGKMKPNLWDNFISSFLRYPGSFSLARHLLVVWGLQRVAVFAE